MATPKKKISRSRRNMRRFASGNKLLPVTWTTSALTQDPIRPHTVTLETVAAYVASRANKKAARGQAKKSS
jgi:ribosomal protein L32